MRSVEKSLKSHGLEKDFGVGNLLGSFKNTLLIDFLLGERRRRVSTCNQVWDTDSHVPPPQGLLAWFTKPEAVRLQIVVQYAASSADGCAGKGATSSIVRKKHV